MAQKGGDAAIIISNNIHFDTIYILDNYIMLKKHMKIEYIIIKINLIFYKNLPIINLYVNILEQKIDIAKRNTISQKLKLDHQNDYYVNDVDFDHRHQYFEDHANNLKEKL